MKKFLIQIVLLLAVIAVALYLFKTNPDISNIPFVTEQAVTKQVDLGGTKFTVDVADTQAKRSKGLGGRLSLGPNEGMLFVFEKPDKPAFWMKGLSFPLDFIWIRENKVVDLHQNIQPPKPGQSDDILPIYEPKEVVDKVLEVNGGIIQKLNIKVGDEIKIE